MTLAGRRVLVTGAASGIGRATALLAAEAGAQVAALDRNEAQLATLDAPNVHPFACDLSRPDGIEAVVSGAIDRLGGLDGVVNCAGVHIGLSVEELSRDVWNHALAVNLTAPFVICRAALPALRASRGAIVNVASGAGILPDTPRTTAYAASKGGLIAFTKALAAEIAPDVRANIVCPGLTETPMTAHMTSLDEETRQRSLARYALKRAAAPEEIARVILFLISDSASFVTGATLAADGGRTFH